MQDVSMVHGGFQLPSFGNEKWYKNGPVGCFWVISGQESDLGPFKFHLLVNLILYEMILVSMVGYEKGGREKGHPAIGEAVSAARPYLLVLLFMRFASTFVYLLSGQPSRFELMSHCNQPNLISAGGCPGCVARNQAKSLPKWGLQEIVPRLA
eukprot:1146820-Pelagomonas_calceolata.AAC.1